jgi:hypothetical protein
MTKYHILAIGGAMRRGCLNGWCLVALLALAGGATRAESGEPLTRLVFQDLKASSLRWADVLAGGKGALTLGEVGEVAGFPKLDAKRQKLVQMQEHNGLVLVGVRDTEDGAYQSGWVLLHTGVGYADHGDHGHWSYKKKPEVWDSRLDASQGNPAHVYVYDGCFYVAHDKTNGYTRVEAAKYATNAGRKLGKDTPRFLTGGGGHITLAVVGDKVGYSCWIDKDGPNKGKVDVTAIHGKGQPAYSFTLPSGTVHGAAAAAGKVFFAPSDGVCWVEADEALRLKPEDVKVHHIPLGKDGDTPRRTGAFTTHGHHVLFTTGKEDGSALIVLGAKQAEPKPTTLTLKAGSGRRAGSPVAVTTADKKNLAFVFVQPAKGGAGETELAVVDLDPNGDGAFLDAKLVKTLKLTGSSVAFDADRKYAFVTSPGDGTITALTLKTLEPVATFKVGGMPTALVARGGLDHED